MGCAPALRIEGSSRILPQKRWRPTTSAKFAQFSPKVRTCWWENAWEELWPTRWLNSFSLKTSKWHCWRCWILHGQRVPGNLSSGGDGCANVFWYLERASSSELFVTGGNRPNADWENACGIASVNSVTLRRNSLWYLT